MFYSNNDNYMQDLYFYNQIPNNPTYMNNMPMHNMQMNNQPNQMMNPNMMYGNQNLNNFYPSIYRIIMPVVSNVVANSNYQYLTEDLLNNMVETVYNIVDGQIDYGDEDLSRNNSASSNNSNNSTSITSSNSSTNTMSSQRTTENRQTLSNSRNNKNDELLKDIIKILILKEIQHKRQFQNRQFTYQQYCNQQPYMNY